MLSKAQISVLLPVRNGEATIRLAIQSILAQTFQDFELLVLEDGSEDNTVSIIKEFNDERIILLADGLKKGITERLNEGIKKSKGIWIARMDADDISYPERFERQIEFLRLHPNIDVVGTSMIIFKENTEVLGKRIVPINHQEIVRDPLRGFPLMHPTFMGKRTWFEKFRYEICLGSEDQDLLLRSYRQSEFSNIGDILFAYREVDIEPQKYKRGRESYLSSLLKTGHLNRGNFNIIYRRLFNKIKNLRDKMALVSSLRYKLLTNRAAPVDNSDIEQFKKAIKQIEQNHLMSNE